MRTILRQRESANARGKSADIEAPENESVVNDESGVDTDLVSAAGGAESDQQADTHATEDVDTEDEEPSEPVDNDNDSAKDSRGERWKRRAVFILFPALIVLLGAAAGYLKFQQAAANVDHADRLESVRAATDSTIAILSYKPDTIDKDLGAATDRLTGSFRDSYHALTTDVVIPGAKQKQITAVASVPAAASVTVHNNTAVVLLFVNQTTTIGTDAPTNTASSVRVTLDKVGNRWLIARFEPI